MAKIRWHQRHLIIDWRDTNGQRHFERVPGDDKAKAKQRLGEILKSGAKASTPATFKEYGDRWLEGKKGELAGSTYQEYEAVLRNHIYPVLGDTPFTKVTKPMVRELIVRKRNEGYEAPTVRNMLAPVRGMYNQAIEDGEPVGNPAAKFGKSNRGKQKTVINPYTKEEVSSFLQKTLANNPKDYPLYLCAVRAGLRRGELIALKGGDIDFERKLIHVQRTFSRGVIKPPKSGKTRLVDMSTQLTRVLSELHRKPDEWVFQSPQGMMLDESNLYKSFQRFLEENELRKIRFHDLRHTMATLQIKNNQSLAYIQQQLGHSSIKITVDLYGHLVPGYNRGAADMLDD